MKAVRAAITGSALAAALTAIGLTTYNAFLYQDHGADFIRAMLSFLILSFFVTAAVACTIGLLWHRLAQSRGWTTVHAYWLPALLLGVLAPIVLMALPLLSPSATAPSVNIYWVRTFVTLLSVGAALGGLTGLCAWFIRRPDRDAANPPTSPP